MRGGGGSEGDKKSEEQGETVRGKEMITKWHGNDKKE